MDGKDGFWAITALQLGARIIDRFYYFSRVDVESVRLHIDEDGARAYLFNHVDARTKCHWSCQDRVTGTDPQADQSKMQGCRAEAQGQRWRRVHGCGKLFLEALHFGTRGNPIRTQCVDYLRNFFLADAGRRE